MPIPNMSSALADWTIPVTIKTITKITVDFEDANTKVERTQDCVIQPADKRKLNPDTIDWTKSYIHVHSVSDINLNEVILFEGADYIVFSKQPTARYGYTHVTAESTEKALL